MGRTRILLIVAILIGVGLLGVGFVVQTVGAKPEPQTLPNTTILYLAPNNLPAAEGLGIPNETLQVQGMQLVHSFEELKQSVAQKKPDAIIVHQRALADVDPKWLATQYRNGVIVGGINLKVSELVKLLNDPTLISDGPPLNETWYKKPYYSFAGKVTTTSGGGQAVSTNNINSREGTFEQFVITLKQNVANFKAMR